MSGPQVHTSKSGNTRYYTHPNTGERAVGVTSVLANLPKDFLKWWAAKVVAEEAVHNFSGLAALVVSDQPSAKEGAVDWLKRAHMRTTTDAATRGTRVHDWTEKIDELGTMPKRVPADILPYMRGYLEFRSQTEAEIIYTETTVWDEVDNYSGTLDRAVLIPESAFAHFDNPPPWYEGAKVPIVGDIKTSQSGVFPEVALQIGAYRMASHLLIPDEHGQYEAVEAPYFSKTGLVIHLRPDAWRLVPTNSGPDMYAIFQALRNSILPWEKSLSKQALYPDVAGGEINQEDVVKLEKLLEELAK